MTLFAKLAFVTGLGLILSGCFVSDEPLINMRDAEPVFPLGAYHAVEYDEESSGKEWTGEIYYVDGMIRSDVDDFPFENMMFRPIDRNIYAAQSSEDDIFMYLILFIHEDGSADMHLPLCDDLSEPARHRHDLSVGDNEICDVSDWQSLRGAFRDYIDEYEGQMSPHVRFFPIDESELPESASVGKPPK